MANLHAHESTQDEALRAPRPEDWRDWIPDAHRIIEDWEADTKGRMLSMRDSLALAEHIAKALHAAFERGHDD